MAIDDEFSVRVSQEDGGPVEHVAGELDLAARDLVTEAIDGVREGADRLVLDLTAVTFVDSGGLQAVLGAFSAQREAGGELVLRRPSPPVLRILEMTGIAAAIPIEAEAPTSP